MPGEQLAQNILDANLLNVLQLVIVLFVLAIVLLVAAILAMMYYNSQAVSKMSGTQQSMMHSNAQMITADGEKTKVMQGTLEEVKLFRQDFGASAATIQRGIEMNRDAIGDHEAKSDTRVQTIVDKVSNESRLMQDAMKSVMTDLVGEAVGTIKGNTIEAVAPALGLINDLKHLTDTISTRQDTAIEQVQKMQMEQIEALRRQNDAHIRVLNAHLTQAQQDIMNAIRKAEEEIERENKNVMVIGGPAGDDISVGDSGGSTGDSRTGHSGAINGTSGG